MSLMPFVMILLFHSKHGDASKIEIYRGITLSLVLSKLLESCLLGAFEEILISDNLQFGFKKKSICNHALFTLHGSVKYYTKYGAKVCEAFLDASKAFDKVAGCLKSY